MHLNPRSGRWNPDASARAHHIGIAIAYNVWQYYQVTGDLEFLIDYGAEMLLEIARFWVEPGRLRRKPGPLLHFRRHRARRIPLGIPRRTAGRRRQQRVHQCDGGVGRHARVRGAGPAAPAEPAGSAGQAGAARRRAAHWDDVSRRMFVPFHDGVISQFEGYGELAELDWDAYRKRYGNIQRLDRILEAENDDINRYKASKQADALMLLYLLSSDELREVLDRLGYHLTPEQIPKMVDYYLARTSHGSTLSAVVHAWVLARANRRAVDFFQQVLRSDVADIQGGTTFEGIHLAAMAGSVDLVQRCFTGLETRSERIMLSPQLPKKLGTLAFPIHYRGLHLHLRVRGRGVEISVDPRDMPPAEVECRGRVVELMPGTTVLFRAISRSFLLSCSALRLVRAVVVQAGSPRS